MKTRNRITALLTVLLIASSKSFSASWLYTVRPGDTLWDLCQRYTNEPSCWYTLDKVNNVKFPRRLPPGFVINFPVNWLKAVPRPVEVSFVNGAVSVKLAEDAQAQAVTAGDKLPIGTKIITHEGTINLRFADGSTMQLEESSELLLDTLSSFDGMGIVDSRLRLNQGAVKTRVKKRKPASRFQITTPAAVAAVRGTVYRVSTAAGAQPIMRGEVFEGRVDVSANRKAQSVVAGFGIIAKKGVPLAKPLSLLPAPQLAANETPKMLPVTLSWQALSGAQAYQLELFHDNDREELIQRIALKTQQYTVTELPVGCYRVRLRAIDVQQLQGLAAREKLCIAPTLTAPHLQNQFFDRISEYRSNLTIPAVESVAQYRFQVATDAEFNHLVEEHLVDTPQLTIAGQQPLFIRVQLLGNQGQTTAYSNVHRWQPEINHWPATIIFGLFFLAIF